MSVTWWHWPALILPRKGKGFLIFWLAFAFNPKPLSVQFLCVLSRSPGVSVAANSMPSSVRILSHLFMSRWRPFLCTICYPLKPSASCSWPFGYKERYKSLYPARSPFKFLPTGHLGPFPLPAYLSVFMSWGSQNLLISSWFSLNNNFQWRHFFAGKTPANHVQP